LTLTSSLAASTSSLTTHHSPPKLEISYYYNIMAASSTSSCWSPRPSSSMPWFTVQWPSPHPELQLEKRTECFCFWHKRCEFI
jgi:hypothetical protein